MSNYRDDLIRGKAFSVLSQSQRLSLGCEYCGAIDWGIGTFTTTSGSVVHPYYCRECGHKTSYYATKEAFMEKGDERKFSLPKEELLTCEVCGNTGAEQHHWAPYYIFGWDADRWPTSLLCISCHKHWHKMIRCYRPEKI